MRAVLSLLLCIALQLASVEILQAQSPKPKSSAPEEKPEPRKGVANPSASLQRSAQEITEKEARERGGAISVLEGTPGMPEGITGEEEGGGERERSSARPEIGKPVPPQPPVAKQGVPPSGVPLWVWTLVAALIVCVVVGVGWISWRAIGRFRERLPQEIDSRVDPLFRELQGVSLSLRNLEDICTTLDGHLRELGRFSQQLADRLGTILNEINAATGRITVALQALPAELSKETSDTVQEQLRAEAKKAREGRISELAAWMRKELDGLQQDYPVIGIAHAVKQEFPSLSTHVDPESSVASLAPYAQLANEWETLHREISQMGKQDDVDLGKQEQKVRRAIERLREKASQLARDHRPIWFIPLLEKATGDSTLSEKVRRLKDALGIEDFSVQEDTEAKNLNDLEIASTKGAGRRTIIAEVVERGYRQKATGTVIKKPKVSIRLEG